MHYSRALALLLLLPLCPTAQCKPGHSLTFESPAANSSDYSTVPSDINRLIERQAEYERQQSMWCRASPVVCFHYVCLAKRTELKIAQRRSASNAEPDTRALAVFTTVALDFLKQTYPQPLDVVESRPGFLYVKPPLTQGQVLRDRKLWEELEIKISASVANGRLSVTLVADGRYSAGVNPPKSKTDYVDFEIEYGKQFSEYANRLAVQLEQYLAASTKTAETVCDTRYYRR